MLHLLTDRKKELLIINKKDYSLETIIRLREIVLLEKRVKRVLAAEIDQAGFREELSNLSVQMSFLQPI
jgi:hypothetical protein